MSELIEGFLGKSVEGKKSRLPAKLDYLQSATGLFLGLFMWCHMIFVSTILVSDKFFNQVVDFLEGSMFFEPKPIVTSVIVTLVFAIFFIHALLGMRKLPINFRQWQSYKTHMGLIKHGDTTMWYIQATTGFIMFFFGSAHLIMMIFKADEISALHVAYRVVSQNMWIFYIILLLAVELHGGIGLYRLCVKWGWFEGENAKESRKKLAKVKWALTAFWLALGLITLLAYAKLGLANDGKPVPPKTHASLMIKSDKVGM